MFMSKIVFVKGYLRSHYLFNIKVNISLLYLLHMHIHHIIYQTMNSENSQAYISAVSQTQLIINR